MSKSRETVAGPMKGLSILYLQMIKECDSSEKKKSIVPQCKKSNHWIIIAKTMANIFVCFPLR